MNFLKRLFSKKKKVDEEIIAKPQEQEIQEEPEEDFEVIGICKMCGQEILSNQKWSKQQGMKFHRACYKKLLKTGRGF